MEKHFPATHSFFAHGQLFCFFFFNIIYSCLNNSMFVAKPIVSVNDVITMIITNTSILSEMLLVFLFCFSPYFTFNLITLQL